MSEYARLGLMARVYEAIIEDADRVTLQLNDMLLPAIEVVGNSLVSPAAVVISRAVLVESAPDGELHGVPVAPLLLRSGGLYFEPRSGGVRMRENRLGRGARNPDVQEATHFGMVNVIYHVSRCADYLNGILRELGASVLPRLTIVVGAHAGSRLPGYAQGDGDYRPGHIRPFTGGHYRLSARTTGIDEHFPVDPSGEIHLGPGRRRTSFAGQAAYLRNAAHNPATIYHEFGHHLCRHTADFRLNAEREPDQQRNGKIGPEEGICDYVAASLLGSGRPYGWYRPTRGERRDPAILRRWEGDDERDAHAAGAIWAAALWNARQQLLRQNLLGSPRDHDRAVLRALLQLGTVAARRGQRRPRRDREAERGAPATVIEAYLTALREEGGAHAVEVGASVLAAAGLHREISVHAETVRC